MTYPVTTMIVGAMIFALGAYWKAWPTNSTDTMTNSASATEKPVPGKNSPTISAGGNVSIGHVGDVNINAAPAPQLKLIGERLVPNADGTVARYITVQVVSPYPPNQLVLSAEANDLVTADLNPLDMGMVQYGHRQDGNKYTFFIQSPAGRYDVGVHTKKDTPVRVDFSFK
jgi:hypothetical protein